MKFSQNDILTLMQGKAYRPLLLKELMGVLSVPKKGHEAFSETIEKMLNDGLIVKIRGDRYGLPQKMNLVTGVLQGHAGGYGFIIPTDKKICYDLFIAPKYLMGAKDGDLVVAEITSYPQNARNPEGEIIKILGKATTPGIDTEVIIEEYGLPAEFSQEILSEAESLPDEVSEEMLHGRQDLRGLRTVTIDGGRAKDFDDAVSIEKTADGKFILWVHIADVSHYVPWDSPLDKEAYSRGRNA